MKKYESQGALIKERMDRLGLNTYRLAQAMGLDKTYMGKVVNNKQRERGYTHYHIANPDQVQKLADILRCGTDELYLAAGKLPPDVTDKLLDKPELITAIRNAYKKLEANP